MIAAAVVRALHVTASGRLLRSDPSGSLAVVLVQTVICAVVFAAGAGSPLPSAVTALTPRSWFDVLFLGVLCSVFAFVVQLWAVRRTSASRASILMGTEPVWALIAGVALAGEHILIPGIIGAILIVSASYAGQAIERRHRRSVVEQADLVSPRRHARRKADPLAAQSDSAPGGFSLG